MYSVSTLIFGIAIALYEGADFAGICSAFVPILLIIMGVFGGQVKKTTIEKITVVKKLGGVIEESLNAIRLIASFANEDKEISKFQKLAEETKTVCHKQELWSSLIVGIFKMSIFGYYVYSFYLASIYIQQKRTNPCDNNNPYTTGKLLSVLVAFMTGMMMVFGLTPNI